MLGALVASVACIGVHVFSDGVSRCNDGDRYTSGAAQPSPFHRRFCGWNKWVLQTLTFISLLGLGLCMGSWWKAVLLLTLPGAWFIAHHPTCTDAITMLLAWCAALLLPTHPYVAVLLSCMAGFIHERGPAFAALYAVALGVSWPAALLLLGWVATGWWRKPSNPDHDKLVGMGTWGAIKAHRPYVDLLDGRALGYGLRATIPLACVWLTEPRAWLALAVAFGSRILGTDTCRYLFWAAPPLIALTNAPSWVVLPALAVHLVTFKRAI